MPTPAMSRRSFGAAALISASAAVLGTRAAAAATTTAPTTQRYVVPGEFEPHAGTIMAWPHLPSNGSSGAGWLGQLSAAQAEIAGLAKAIAGFERVIMFAHPGTTDEARAQCGPTVEILEYDIWDCWTRDNGPVFSVNTSRTAMIGLDFVFNGWGKYPYGNDDNLPTGACNHLNVPRKPVDMVLEGGSVIQDGQGTLITTEECLLNPNRNPTMTKARIESVLLDTYGAQKVIWLPYGLDGDNDTDGHVDLCTSYVAPAKLLILTQPGGGPNQQRMAANKAVLQASTDACGRSFELVEIHEQPRWTQSGRDVKIFSYTNHYPVNGGVIVPQAGVPTADSTALSIIGSLYPGREVVGVPARTLAWNGGQVHCVTQQIPRIG